MTTPNPEPCVDGIVTTDGSLPAGLTMTTPRNNRRPYKADIRGLAEEELAASAEAQIALERKRIEAIEGWESALNVANAWRALSDDQAKSERRWRIACLVVAVVGVVGWIL